MLMSLLIFFILTLSLIIMLLTLSLSMKIFSDQEKMSPFECGFSISMMKTPPFSMHFFMVALVFLIFDMEIILIFPFLMNLATNFTFLSIILNWMFLLILSTGFILEWNQQILEWTK